MPSIYVHNYFAKELKNKIDELKVYKISDPTYLYVFAQSFDNLFYYNFLSLKKGKVYYIYFGFVKGGGDINKYENFEIYNFRLLGSKQETTDLRIYSDNSLLGQSSEKYL